jgi:hypothetical protein
MLTDNEFIFNEKDNQITNIGFSLNSMLNKFQHLIGGGTDDDDDTSSTTSSMSEHLKYVAVPTTLYLTSRQVLGGKHREEINNDEVLSDELHDRLLELIEDKPVKKTSRKNRKIHDTTSTTTSSETKSKKKTRKNKSD